MEAIEKVEGVMAVEDVAGRRRVGRLIEPPHRLGRANWLAVRVHPTFMPTIPSL